MPAIGGPATRITNVKGLDAGGEWSPDGREIAYRSERTGNSEVWVSAADGSYARQVTNNPAGDYSPSWSPDGRWLAFASNRAGHMQIWRVPASGGEAVPVTRMSGRWARWSPDGERIYFIAGDENANGIWAASLKDGREWQVVRLVGETGQRDGGTAGDRRPVSVFQLARRPRRHMGHGRRPQVARSADRGDPPRRHVAALRRAQELDKRPVAGVLRDGKRRHTARCQRFQSSTRSPGTRTMWPRLAVTSVASTARACAAIAASKSSIRVPRRSKAALMRPNIRLTASVHSARGTSAEMRSKRACSAARRFERGSRSMPNAISAITGCGIAMSAGAFVASRSTTAGLPFMSAERAFVSRT